MSGHTQAFPGLQTASLSRDAPPAFPLWSLGFLEVWKHCNMWEFLFLGTTLESEWSGRSRLIGQTTFGGTVSIQHSPQPAPGLELVTRGFDCLGNQCGGSGEEGRVGTLIHLKITEPRIPRGTHYPIPDLEVACSAVCSRQPLWVAFW